MSASKTAGDLEVAAASTILLQVVVVAAAASEEEIVVEAAGHGSHDKVRDLQCPNQQPMLPHVGQHRNWHACSGSYCCHAEAR